jgi:hypothetical protein
MAKAGQRRVCSMSRRSPSAPSAPNVSVFVPPTAFADRGPGGGNGPRGSCAGKRHEYLMRSRACVAFIFIMRVHRSRTKSSLLDWAVLLCLCGDDLHSPSAVAEGFWRCCFPTQRLLRGSSGVDRARGRWVRNGANCAVFIFTIHVHQSQNKSLLLGRHSRACSVFIFIVDVRHSHAKSILLESGGVWWGSRACTVFIFSINIDYSNTKSSLLRRSWLVLAAPCCSFLLLAAPGCSWLFLAAPGCSCLLLAVPGCSWLLLAAPGCS